MTTRDPEVIRRDIDIAELKASNTAIQVDGNLKQIAYLQVMNEKLTHQHHQHLARKEIHEKELAIAMKEREQAPAGETAQAVVATTGGSAE